MGLRDLQRLRKDSSSDQKREKTYVRHLVFGDDIYAFEQYFRLCDKYGESEVGLLTPAPLRFKQLRDLYPMGPSQIRGEDNIACLKGQFPALELRPCEAPSLFLKEGSLREFGGRSKSEKLLFGEEFYTLSKANLVKESDYRELFSCLKRENLLAELAEQALTDIPLRLFATEPTDLVENANWRLEGGSGKDYHCEWLYWCDSPQRFLDLFEEKNKLTNELIEGLEKTFSPCTLFYRIELSKAFGEESSSVFLPLSYTHEWGHFIGDFVGLENENDEALTRADFLSFVEKEATTEEEISKKFRLFKKNLEKIYPQISEFILREWIVLSEKSVCQNTDDKLFNDIQKNSLKLRIVGPHAPLESIGESEQRLGYSQKNLSHLVRGLMSIQR